MNKFSVETIVDNPHLRAPHGVLRAAGLRLAADVRRAALLLVRDTQAKADGILRDARSEASALISNTNKNADAILSKARTEADRILADAREQAQQLTSAEQQRVITQASELLQALKQTNDTLLERAEDIIVGLAQTLYDRLVTDTTPRERINVALKRVLQEAPPKLVDALLRVHPEDAALLPEVDWPVKTDATLVPGACRLEASNGQWCANFDAAVRAVKTAFSQGIEDARLHAPAAEDGGSAGADGERPD